MSFDYSAALLALSLARGENCSQVQVAPFGRRACRRLKISGITLHSYRYAWAERARSCGYPERFAQEALGHNSKSVHRAYSKKAQVLIPTLEEYERKMTTASGDAVVAL